MSLARDMDTLTSAGDQYLTCSDCDNAYHLNTPDGCLINGHGRCVICEWLKPNDPEAVRVMSCVSTVEPYIKRDRSTAEQMRVSQVWIDKNNVWQVTLGSSVSQGVIVMKLTDFYLQYELDRSKESDQELAAPLASNETIYYYVTYSFYIGRQKTFKRGRIAIGVMGASIFSLSGLEKTIKKSLMKELNIKARQVLIENWIKISETEYNDLMADH